MIEAAARPAGRMPQGKGAAAVTRDLTKGPVGRTMLLFSLPLIAGDLLQQCYNVADTLIVGRVLGPAALGSVGAAYSLMTFLTSILLGLALGSGAVFSMAWGKQDEEAWRQSMFTAFVLIGALAAALTAGSFVFLEDILRLLQVPAENLELMRRYLFGVFFGIPATFLYNFFACALRAVGDSAAPLAVLGAAAVVNIGLDLLFVAGLGLGVEGAAGATVLAQYLAGAALAVWTLARLPALRRGWRGALSLAGAGRILRFSLLTCAQQSVMNFGILLVQGRVNSFGPAVMAAFAAGVKIDTFAYLPVQDFGNAFSTFVAQNYGAGEFGRIRRGMKTAVAGAAGFSVLLSALVCLFARPLMGLFVDAAEGEILDIGVGYLRVEGAFYIGIGCLFLLYGLFRAVEMPAVSLVLTVISLGTRVALAYSLSALPAVGVGGIWWSVPIGWFLADAAGFGLFFARRRAIGQKLAARPAEKEVPA